jgi:hypothetical protein
MDFQDGFSYPYFKLTEAVLNELELVSLGPEGNEPSRPVHYFDPGLDAWVKMKVDSVIELNKPSQKLFLKGIHVTSYLSFDRHLGAAATPTSRQNFNPHVSLSQERSYVQQTQAMTQACTSQTLGDLPVVEISSDEDQDKALPVLKLQKRRTQSNQPLMPSSQRRHCDSDLPPSASVGDNSTYFRQQ